jgi:hypothetical protein
MLYRKDYSDVQSFAAAVRWITENHPGKPDLQHVRRQMVHDIEKMRRDKEIQSLARLGYLVERDADGDMRIWVDPELGRR